MRQSISLVLPIGVFLAILFPYLAYIPMWDSGNYLSHCVLEAVSQPFNLLAFNCSNHGSLSFGLIYAVSQYISFGNSLYIHLTSLLLMSVGFYFYYAILKHFFKDQLTIALAMALLCWNPGVVANAINPTPDLLAMVFSIFCLWAFLTQRIAYAALFGVVLMFSKESGVVYYGLCSFLYIVLFISSAKNRYVFLFENCSILCVPWIIYALFICGKMNYAHADFLFRNTSIQLLINHISPVSIFTIPDKIAFARNQPFSPLQPFSIFSAFYAVFLLNFQWIVFAGTLIGLVILYFRQRQETKNFIYPTANREITFVFLLAITLSYILSRFPHYFNMRYYLLLFPVTTLLFIYVLQAVKFARWRVYTGLLAIMFFLSCFYTIDPVSRWFFGTFNLGNHALLSLTARTGECCGYGRDQLVYNLEHTELQTLLQKFAAQVRLNKNDVIVADGLANFFVYERLMARQHYAYGLCLKRDDTAVISMNFAEMELRSAVNQSTRIYYPQMPNVQTDAFTQEVLSHLVPVRITRVTHNGYALNVMQLQVEQFERGALAKPSV